MDGINRVNDEEDLEGVSKFATDSLTDKLVEKEKEICHLQIEKFQRRLAMLNQNYGNTSNYTGLLVQTDQNSKNNESILSLRDVLILKYFEYYGFNTEAENKPVEYTVEFKNDHLVLSWNLCQMINVMQL